MSLVEDSPVAIPVISAILERGDGKDKEILLQTRIAKYDKLYQGAIEIPAGRIERFENVYTTVRREVTEETGLKVVKIMQEPTAYTIKTSRDDEAVVFQPFCCQQLLKGNIPWIGFVFICTVEEGEPKAAQGETKDLRWASLNEVRILIDETPDRIFTLQLPVLDFYLKQNGV